MQWYKGPIWDIFFVSFYQLFQYFLSLFMFNLLLVHVQSSPSFLFEFFFSNFKQSPSRTQWNVFAFLIHPDKPYFFSSFWNQAFFSSYLLSKPVHPIFLPSFIHAFVFQRMRFQRQLYWSFSILLIIFMVPCS